MVYHFVKHIGFDIKADSLEQAKEIAEAIDEYNGIEGCVYDTMIDAIDNALDVGVLREDFFDNSDAHAGDTEYVGYTEDDADDPEERLYGYLADKEVIPTLDRNLGKIFLDAFMKAYTRG